MRMTTSLRTIKDDIADILKNKPETRDSDKLLFIEYLNKNYDLVQVIGGIPFSKLKALLMDERTPSIESLTRMRRKFQENGMYLGKNRNERMKEASEVKKWALGRS